MRNILFTLAALLILSGQVIRAQQTDCPHHMKMKNNDSSVCKMVSNLTPEQEKKIQDLKAPHAEKMNALKKELQTGKKELDALETADKPDTEAINAKIEEIGAIRINMEKERAKHIQDVRSILTEEQKAEFDARMNTNGGCKGKPRQNCMHAEQKNCDGTGKMEHQGKSCPQNH